jgi:hypothetical protein
VTGSPPVQAATPIPLTVPSCPSPRSVSASSRG